jgi:hypothetical protein
MFEFLTRVCALGSVPLPKLLATSHHTADVDPDIPSIAVIGWQSAGKSFAARQSDPDQPKGLTMCKSRWHAGM